MRSILRTIDQFFSKTLWEIDLTSLRESEIVLISMVRLLYKIGQEFSNGEIPRRASSLVYTTLLTLVPTMAVVFSALKVLGVHNMIEPFLRNFLAPLGEKGTEISSNIIGYVSRIDVGLLGAIGLVTLVYTVMNTIQQVETAFNYLWQVSEKRGLVARFRDYMGVVIVGPILMVGALGVTTAVMSSFIIQKIASMEPFGTALFITGELLPYFLISAAFTFMYYVLPNMSVSIKSAVIGGVSAGISWEAGSWLFTRFILSSTQYSAVYSGFAIVLLLMIWIYYNWLILLVGAKISFYHQFPILLRMRDDRMLQRGRSLQRLAIMVMYLIGYNHLHDRPRWTLGRLIERLQIPRSVIQDVLAALERNGLIVSVVSDQSVVPARDIGTITLGEAVLSVRDDLHAVGGPFDEHDSLPGLDKIVNEIESTTDAIFSRYTFRELITSGSITQRDTTSRGDTL